VQESPCQGDQLRRRLFAVSVRGQVSGYEFVAARHTGGLTYRIKGRVTNRPDYITPSQFVYSDPFPRIEIKSPDTFPRYPHHHTIIRHVSIDERRLW
jgi:hypothetical protein